MTTDTVNRNAKDRLARLLAGEDLEVRHEPVQTASFDPEGRVLRLPTWKHMDDEITDFLIAHEVGHALYTPPGAQATKDACNRVDPKNPRVAMSYLNIVEDARIERKIKSKYPGTRRDFAGAYPKLLDKGFFGDNADNPNACGIADRVNLHYKIGHLLPGGVRFNATEQDFIDRIDAARSFEDVIEISKDLYDYAKEEEPETDSGEGQPGDDPSDGDETGEAAENTAGKGNPDPNSDSETGDGDPSEDDAEDGDGEGSGESTENGEESSDSGGSMDDDTDDGESAESTEGDTSSNSDDEGEGSPTGSADPGDPDRAAPEPSTESNLRESLENMVDMSADTVETVYAADPVTEDFVIDYTEILNEWRGTNLDFTDRPFKKFADLYRKRLAKMAQRFDMKKAAETHKRVMVAKTGVLDTVRMVDYKFTEDIFRRNTIVPSGKNHGMVMFVDWSGSMDDKLSDTMIEILVFASFCKKVRIPFEVYAFTTAWSHYNDPLVTRTKSNKDGDLLVGSHVKLLNLLSSRAKNSDYNRLFRISQTLAVFNGRTRPGLPASKAVRYMSLPNGSMSKFNLGGTPLDECIYVSRSIVREFVKKNKVEIPTVIYLTDGGGYGSPLSQGTILKDGKESYLSDRHSRNDTPKVVMVDRETKKSYEGFGQTYGSDTTSPLMDWVRETTGARIVGYFVQTGSYCQYSGRGNNVQSLNEGLRTAGWAHSTEMAGYDDFFVVSTNAVNAGDRNSTVIVNTVVDLISARLF